MPEQPSSQARLLAPVALAVVAIAFFSIVFTSGSGGGGGKEETQPASTHKKGRGRGASGGKRVYRVKAGDTLGKIAEKTGVSVDKLQELNPQLDPQSLVSGQKIKLKE